MLPAVSLLSLMTTALVLVLSVVWTSLFALHDAAVPGLCLDGCSSVSLSVVVALMIVAWLLLSSVNLVRIGCLRGLRVSVASTALLAVLVSVCVAFLFLLVTGRYCTLVLGLLWWTFLVTVCVVLVVARSLPKELGVYRHCTVGLCSSPGV